MKDSEPRSLRTKILLATGGIAAGITVLAGCDSEAQEVIPGTPQPNNTPVESFAFPEGATCHEVSEAINSMAGENGISVINEKYAFYTGPATIAAVRRNLQIGVLYADPERVPQEQFVEDVNGFEAMIVPALEKTNVAEEGDFIRIYAKARRVSGGVEFADSENSIERGDIQNDNQGCVPLALEE